MTQSPVPKTVRVQQYVHHDDRATLENVADRTSRPVQWGDNPLITAVKRGQSRKVSRILQRDQREHGLAPLVAINTLDKDGLNAMHQALRYSHPKVVKALERYGALVKGPSPERSPLALAIERKVHHRSYKHRQSEMVAYLVQRGEAPIEGSAPEPWPNFLINQRQMAAFDLLIQLPAARGWRWDVDLSSEMPGEGPLEHFADRSRSDAQRFKNVLAISTPLIISGRFNVLHAAVDADAVEAVKGLLDHPQALALVTALDQDGLTPVHTAVMRAVERGPTPLAILLAMLAYRQASPLSLLDAKGNTPLLKALEVLRTLKAENTTSPRRCQRLPEILTMLTHAGADWLVKNHEGIGVPDVLADNEPLIKSSTNYVKAWAWVKAQSVAFEERKALKALADTLPALPFTRPRL